MRFYRMKCLPRRGFFQLFAALLLIGCCLMICSCSKKKATTESAVPQVLVSVPPLKFFVECIAGNTVHVELLVPPGASPHSYEVTPRQVIAASQAIMWV